MTHFTIQNNKSDLYSMFPHLISPRRTIEHFLAAPLFSAPENIQRRLRGIHANNLLAAAHQRRNGKTAGIRETVQHAAIFRIAARGQTAVALIQIESRLLARAQVDPVAQSMLIDIDRGIGDRTEDVELVCSLGRLKCDFFLRRGRSGGEDEPREGANDFLLRLPPPSNLEGSIIGRIHIPKIKVEIARKMKAAQSDAKRGKRMAMPLLI